MCSQGTNAFLVHNNGGEAANDMVEGDRDVVLGKEGEVLVLLQSRTLSLCVILSVSRPSRLVQPRPAPRHLCRAL